jgi:hypothetical protein
MDHEYLSVVRCITNDWIKSEPHALKSWSRPSNKVKSQARGTAPAKTQPRTSLIQVCRQVTCVVDETRILAGHAPGHLSKLYELLTQLLVIVLLDR